MSAAAAAPAEWFGYPVPMPEVMEQRLLELLMQVRRDMAELKAGLREVRAEIQGILLLLQQRKSP